MALVGGNAGAFAGPLFRLSRREFAGGGSFLLQSHIFACRIAEHRDGAHHVADLVAALATFDRNFQIAIGKTLHHFGYPAQRTTQGLDQHQTTGDRQDRADDHGDDRKSCRSFAVFLADFLGLGDEILQSRHCIGQSGGCLRSFLLPVRSD